MATRNLNKEDSQGIRMVFQRLCEGEDLVQVAFGTFNGEFKVLAEAPDRVILGISDLERGQWRLKAGARLTLKLLDRGLPFEAVVDFQGHGKLHGAEACHVSMPRLLRALETHRLADFVPDRPIPCPFSDQRHDVKDGTALAFGEDGLELAPPAGTKVLGDMLRLNATSSVELRAAVGESLVLPVMVGYFGEKVWGLRFTESADKLTVSRYRQWLLEARHQQANKDRNRFNPGGLESSRLTGRTEATRSAAATTPRLHVDRDPLVLVLAEGEAFPVRLAEAIGRKFGLVSLDLGPGLLKPALGDLVGEGPDWGRIRLVMIYHRLRSGTTLERCRRLAQDEACPLPILMAGTEEDADLKRNRAVAAGAMDYLIIEPFQILNVIRTLDQTIKLFG
jgi:CheY-like chemotaxis protein